ncbi:uncharacterized protein LOC142464502 [Ascaphus truei]|uniref:uncharacterized protein LOC142464502 n=1 Tax=Ascaphus truei TaxID=8439 RepID=UPI003F591238
MTTESTMRLLYTITEGSQGETPPASPQSAGSITPAQEMEQEVRAPSSTAAEDTLGKQPEGTTAFINGPFSKGRSHPRLAQLRGQIRAQVREHSPRSPMMELVEKVTQGQASARAQADGGGHHGAQEGIPLYQCSSPTCFASELEGMLHAELTALRLEVKSSLQAMRAELGQELRALHREVKVCCHHCPIKDGDPPKPGEKRPEWKSVFRKVSRKDEQEVRSPARLDRQIKAARSVPSLANQSAPSRNQVLLRAMTTIAARNALMSGLGTRSNSDPAQPPPRKPSHKPTMKTQEAAGHSNGNWGRKVTPLPQNGAPAAEAH